MTLSLLPPRGIFIPTHMIFNPQLPPAVLVTWIQLRCLAWGGWVTTSLSMQELAVLTGKNQAKLYRHMSQLRHLSALSWRSTGQGTIIVSFSEPPSTNHPIDNPPVILNSQKRGLPVPPGDLQTTILNSQSRELPYLPSYFPPRILGYLSFEEDDDGFLNVKEDSENLEDEGEREYEVERDFLNSRNCKHNQHAIFLKQSLPEGYKGSHAHS